jgi:hypothetical protein
MSVYLYKCLGEAHSRSLEQTHLSFPMGTSVIGNLLFRGGLERKLDALYRIYKAQIWVQLVECLSKIKQTLKVMNKA